MVIYKYIDTISFDCSTNVASNVGQAAAAGPANRYGPGSGQDQMVVLRGDLVTICK